MDLKNNVLVTQTIVKDTQPVSEVHYYELLGGDADLLHQSILFKIDKESQKSLSDLDYTKRYFKIDSISTSNIFNMKEFSTITITGVNPMNGFIITKYFTHTENFDFILSLINNHKELDEKYNFDKIK